MVALEPGPCCIIVEGEIKYFGRTSASPCVTEGSGENGELPCMEKYFQTNKNQGDEVENMSSERRLSSV